MIIARVAPERINVLYLWSTLKGTVPFFFMLILEEQLNLQSKLKKENLYTLNLASMCSMLSPSWMVMPLVYLIGTSVIVAYE